MTPEQQKALALARARKRRAEAQGGQMQAMSDPTASDYAGQFGAGSQQGIAQMLGFPVDAVNSAIGGVGELTGLWETAQRPFGGSEMIGDALAPFRSGVREPQTAGERFTRRVGEEVGASAVGLPLAIASAPSRPIAAAGVELASALGSGLGAGTAQEIAPDSVSAEVIGALMGGLPAGMAASRATGLDGSDAVMRGGIDDQRMRASDAYDVVRNDPRVLPQDSVDDMALGLSGRMDAERINPRLQPGSSAVLDAILQDSSGPMRIEDIENLRRMTTQNMPVTAAARDHGLAKMMKDEITGYLDNLGDPISDALIEGRDAHRRASAAQSIDAASTKAARRAASTGSGGNEINAMRQNLRSILDNPRKARSFTAAEREMMDQIVRGTGGQNAMRSLSRFAPTSGGLSAMLGIGGAMASPAVALPIMAATELAKIGGERSSRRVIEALMQSIAPDRVLTAGDAGISPVIQALLAARMVSGDE